MNALLIHLMILLALWQTTIQANNDMSPVAPARATTAISSRDGVRSLTSSRLRSIGTVLQVKVIFATVAMVADKHTSVHVGLAATRAIFHPAAQRRRK